MADGAAEGLGASLAAAVGDMVAAGRLPHAAYAPPRLVRATPKLRARVKTLAADVVLTSPSALPIAAAACKAAAPGAVVPSADEVAARLAEAVTARVEAAGGQGEWHGWRVEAAGAHLNFHAPPGTDPVTASWAAAPGGAGSVSGAGGRQAARVAPRPGHGLCEAVEARLCGHAAAALEAAARELPAAARASAAVRCSSSQVPPAAAPAPAAAVPARAAPGASAGGGDLRRALQAGVPDATALSLHPQAPGGRAKDPSPRPAHASLVERPCDRPSGDAHPAAPAEEHAAGEPAGGQTIAADFAGAHRLEVVMLPSSQKVGGPCCDVPEAWWAARSVCMQAVHKQFSFYSRLSAGVVLLG